MKIKGLIFILTFIFLIGCGTTSTNENIVSATPPKSKEDQLPKANPIELELNKYQPERGVIGVVTKIIKRNNHTILQVSTNNPKNNIYYLMLNTKTGNDDQKSLIAILNILKTCDHKRKTEMFRLPFIRFFPTEQLKQKHWGKIDSKNITCLNRVEISHTDFSRFQYWQSVSLKSAMKILPQFELSSNYSALKIVEISKFNEIEISHEKVEVIHTDKKTGEKTKGTAYVEKDTKEKHYNLIVVTEDNNKQKYYLYLPQISNEKFKGDCLKSILNPGVILALPIDDNQRKMGRFELNLDQTYILAN